MKKKLLIIAFASFAFTNFTSAQNKEWDLGNNGGGFWPITATAVTAGTTPTVDGLTLNPGASAETFGIIEASSATWDDGYSGENRFKLNGGGGAGASYMPIQRFLSFPVTGPCTVKVWFKTGGSSLRTLFVTDGTSLVNSLGDTDSSKKLVLTANYTGTGGTLYIYGDQSCNLYKIETTTKLSTNDFQSQSLVRVYTNGKQVSVDNVISKTEINVYSITGALVKSINTNTNTNFNLSNSGLYIVRAKSVEGVKTTKLAIR